MAMEEMAMSCAANEWADETKPAQPPSYVCVSVHRARNLIDKGACCGLEVRRPYLLARFGPYEKRTLPVPEFAEGAFFNAVFAFPYTKPDDLVVLLLDRRGMGDDLLLGKVCIHVALQANAPGTVMLHDGWMKVQPCHWNEQGLFKFRSDEWLHQLARGIGGGQSRMENELGELKITCLAVASEIIAASSLELVKGAGDASNQSADDDCESSAGQVSIDRGLTCSSIDETVYMFQQSETEHETPKETARTDNISNINDMRARIHELEMSKLLLEEQLTERTVKIKESRNEICQLKDDLTVALTYIEELRKQNSTLEDRFKTIDCPDVPGTNDEKVVHEFSEMRVSDGVSLVEDPQPSESKDFNDDMSESTIISEPNESPGINGVMTALLSNDVNEHVIQQQIRMLQRIVVEDLPALHVPSNDELISLSTVKDTVLKLLSLQQEAQSRLRMYRDTDSTGHMTVDEGMEMTMAYLKGQVTLLTKHELEKSLQRTTVDCSRNAESVFKRAHVDIKRVILRVGGEQVTDQVWTLNNRMILSLSPLEYSSCLQNLRTLVVAYDNLTPQQRRTLTTASEIVKNRDWLVQLAKRCIEVEKDRSILSSSRIPSSPLPNAQRLTGGSSVRTKGSSPLPSLGPPRPRASPRGNK